VTLLVQTVPYSGVCALADTGRKPAKLTGDALLLCAENEELIVLRRGSTADGVKDYPGWLHIFGGAYKAAGHTSTDSDRGRLVITALRESREESAAQFFAADAPPMMLCRESAPQLNYVTLVLLGRSVTSSSAGELLPSWEGTPLRIPFADLPEWLSRGDWVPLAKASIFAWLALGAPNTKPNQRFRDYTPQELFEIVMAQK
jgi:hypothetical protein